MFTAPGPLRCLGSLRVDFGTEALPPASSSGPCGLSRRLHTGSCTSTICRFRAKSLCSSQPISQAGSLRGSPLLEPVRIQRHWIEVHPMSLAGVSHASCMHMCSRCPVQPGASMRSAGAWCRFQGSLRYMVPKAFHSTQLSSASGLCRPRKLHRSWAR